MRDEAIRLAKAGFRVTPLAGKRPLWADWQRRPLTDPFDVFETWPAGAYNVGIVCGDGLAVLDVDPKAGGFEALAKLQAAIGPLPTTRVVRTRSGGLHFYFRTPGGDVSNSNKGLVAAFGPGLDVRGAGGQVVAPGSVVDGAAYSLESDGPIAEIPAGLLDALQGAAARSLAAGSLVGEVDTPAAVAACRRVLEAAGEVSEGARDNAAFQIAARFYDFGVSETTCRELLDEWSELKCSPSLDDSDLDRIAASAAKNRQDVIGRDNPVLGFDVIEPPPAEALECPFRARVKKFTQTEADAAALPPRPWLAYRRLIRGKLTSLVAPGSIGKSLLSLQWACALAMGDGAWCGLEVRERTNVLILNNEDEIEEMEQRLAAIIKRFGLPREEIWNRIHLASGSDDPLILMRRNGRFGGLVETEHAARLVAYCLEEQIGALMIDPLVDCHEANENDNAEMSAVMRMLRRVAKKTGAALMFVHHTKKPPAAGAEGFAGSADAGRGATAVINAARVGLTAFNMSEKDAQKFGVAEARRNRFVRVDDSKANLFLASPDAQWFERETVVLPNGESMGVFVPAVLVDASASDVAAFRSELVAIAGAGRFSVTAVAKMIAEKSTFYGGQAPATIARKILAVLPAPVEIDGMRVAVARNGQLGGEITITRET